MWVRFLQARPYYGVVSVKVNTTDCDSVNMGSIPILLPRSLIVVFEGLDPVDSSFMIAEVTHN